LLAANKSATVFGSRRLSDYREATRGARMEHVREADYASETESEFDFSR